MGEGERFVGIVTIKDFFCSLASAKGDRDDVVVHLKSEYLERVIAELRGRGLSVELQEQVG